MSASASIGNELRRRRRQLGLTQADVARIAGVGRRFVSELERGKSGAELGRVLKVTDALGLDMTLRPAGVTVLDAGGFEHLDRALRQRDLKANRGNAWNWGRFQLEVVENDGAALEVEPLG